MANASKEIDGYIASLGDWRGKMIAQIRKAVLAASPEIVEEWKWGTPVWSAGGNVCAAGAFKDHVKINFFRGASLPDPKKLFNAGLDAKTSRAIDIPSGGKLDEAGLRALVKAAVGGSVAKAAGKASRKSSKKPSRKSKQ